MMRLDVRAACLLFAACLSLGLGACHRSPPSRVETPGSATSARAMAVPGATSSLSEPDADTPELTGGLEQLVAAFPGSTLVSAAGRSSLGERLTEIAAGIRRDARGAPVRIAFVVDHSTPANLVTALELAFARSRDQLPQGHFALISCGTERGAWVAKLEAPFDPEPYSILRAANRVIWEPSGSGVGASWTALNEAARLDWNGSAAPRHVVLVSDDRPHRETLRLDGEPPKVSAELEARVRTWAKTSHVILHAIRAELEQNDGRGGTMTDDAARSGVPLAHVTGLFREAKHSTAGSVGQLETALASALKTAGAGASSDVALVLDDSGVAKDALPALRRVTLPPAQRLALVRFGATKPRVVFELTANARAVEHGLTGITASTGDDSAKDVLGAIATAEKLHWSADAKKAIVVVSGAPARFDTRGFEAATWAADHGVALTFIELLPSFSRR